MSSKQVYEPAVQYSTVYSYVWCALMVRVCVCLDVLLVDQKLEVRSECERELLEALNHSLRLHQRLLRRGVSENARGGVRVEWSGTLEHLGRCGPSVERTRFAGGAGGRGFVPGEARTTEHLNMARAQERGAHMTPAPAPAYH